MSVEYRETEKNFVAKLTNTQITDAEEIDRYGDELIEICKLASNAGKGMVVDLCSVQFMSTAMLNQFMGLNQAAKNGNVELHLARLHMEIHEVFKITKLSRVFSIVDDHPDLGEAV